MAICHFRLHRAKRQPQFLYAVPAVCPQGFALFHARSVRIAGGHFPTQGEQNGRYHSLDFQTQGQ